MVNLEFLFRELPHKISPRSGKLFKGQDDFRFFLGRVRAFVKQGLGNAWQIQIIGGCLVIVALVFSLPGVDASDPIARIDKGLNEVLNLGRIIFAAKKNVLFFNPPMRTGAADLLQKLLKSFWRIVNRKLFLKNITKPVAKEHDVLGFCVVDGDAEGSAG